MNDFYYFCHREILNDYPSKKTLYIAYVAFTSISY